MSLQLVKNRIENASALVEEAIGKPRRSLELKELLPRIIFELEQAVAEARNSYGFQSQVTD